MKKYDLEKLELLPKEPGVYLMKNEDGTILYVGKAKEVRSRVKQYFVPGRDGRLMVPYLTIQIAHIDTIITPSEKEALLLENTLIKKHQPKYNVLLKDDKTFISLMINHRHQYPMIRLVRFKGKPNPDGLYFGPYTSALAARETLDVMAHVFPLRQCSDSELKSRTRPCLLYSIKRCIAPCVQKCTQEEYNDHTKRAIKFLKGQDKEIIQELENEMAKASENLQYEKCASLLKTIKQIREITQNSRTLVHSLIKDCDVFNLFRKEDQFIIMQLLFREGKMIGAEHYVFNQIAATQDEIWESFLIQHYKTSEDIPPEILLPTTLENQAALEEIFTDLKKKKVILHKPERGEKLSLLKLARKNAMIQFYQEKKEQSLSEEILMDLQETLQLTRCPVTIECFDTSNISGSDLVASMITYTDGAYDKKRHRLFKVKGITKPDDYGALEEVLTRHYTKAKEADQLPDLLMVDGGKGQLNIALSVFKELEIASVDIISLAKEEGRHDKGLTKERIFVPHKKEPISLSIHSPLIQFLQKVRDEAHRVAINFHRKRRTKRVIKSSLDAIPGIGPKKRMLLLTHFGSVKNLKKATQEDLQQVKGLTKRDITTLLQFIQS